MKNNKSNPVYYLLGILAAIFSTPAIIYILTINASEFEGGKALGQIFLVPVVFVFLLIAWLVIHRIYKNRTNYYRVANTIFLSCILISGGSFSAYFFKEHQESVQKKRNSQKCQSQYKDAYEGMVIDAKDNFVKIRKMNDGKYDEFHYYFKLSFKVNDDFFVGQRLNKNANTEFFSIDLKDGKQKEFNIPCYD